MVICAVINLVRTHTASQHCTQHYTQHYTHMYWPPPPTFPHLLSHVPPSPCRSQTINAAVYTIENVLIPNMTISSPAPKAEQARANVTASPTPTTSTSNTTGAPTPTTVAARSSAARSSFNLAYTMVLAAALLLALIA